MIDLFPGTSLTPAWWGQQWSSVLWPRHKSSLLTSSLCDGHGRTEDGLTPPCRLGPRTHGSRFLRTGRNTGSHHTPLQWCCVWPRDAHMVSVNSVTHNVKNSQISSMLKQIKESHYRAQHWLTSHSSAVTLRMTRGCSHGQCQQSHS